MLPIEKVLFTVISLIGFFLFKIFSDKYLKYLINMIPDKEKRTLFIIFIKIIWTFLFVTLVFFLLDYWGINITPLLASLGILSVIVGLALQNSLSNFFSGLFLTADQSIRIGDFIELPEYNIVGRIENIGWRSTRIRTLENNIVYIPNSKLANSIVVNYSRPKEEILIWFDVGISYFEDLEKVEKITLEVANEVEKKYNVNWEPKLYYYNFGDSNIYFKIVLKAKDFFNAKEIVHEFMKKLKERYDKEGIEISFPNVNVFLRYGRENYKLSI